MYKAITKFESSNNSTNNWIAVGDVINGKKITEIWSSSVGSPVFVVDGFHYSWNDLFKILPEGEKDQDHIQNTIDNYISATKGA